MHSGRFYNIFEGSGWAPGTSLELWEQWKLGLGTGTLKLETGRSSGNWKLELKKGELEIGTGKRERGTAPLLFFLLALVSVRI